MKNSITPFLWFNDDAEAAMNHYLSIFPNSRADMVSRYPEGMPDLGGKVMVARFTLDGASFLALNGGPMYAGFTPAISFMIDCETQDEVDHYWDRLTEGGEPGECGWLRDKFGVSWQVIPKALGELTSDPDPARVARVMQAMMKMSKIDIAQLKAAHDGSL